MASSTKSRNQQRRSHEALRVASRLYTPGTTRTALAREAKADRPDLPKTTLFGAAEAVIEARTLELENGRPCRDNLRPAGPPLSLEDRLDRARQRLVAQSFHQLYRTPVNSEIAVEVDRADDGNVSASVDTVEGWIDYKSQGYRRGITGVTARLTVGPNWLGLYRRGLGTADGLLTLRADLVETTPDGIEVYDAAWVKQGRGVSVSSQSGWLCRHAPSGATYHGTGKTPGRAVTALREKAGLVDPAILDARNRAREEAKARRRQARIAQAERLVERIARWDLSAIEHVPVSRLDSLRAGNCAPGTDQFIAIHFPEADPRTDTVTIGAIAEKVGRFDLGELDGAALVLARQIAAACLSAIRRDRNARRALGV